MSLIENLQRIMSEKKVNIETLKDLIEKSGHSLSRNSISNILNEKTSPKIETVELIAAALGVDVWRLFTSSMPPDHRDNINGFVEYKGTIYRIQSVEDVERLLAMVKL